MPDGLGHPDWTRSEDYRGLTAAGRAMFAWEWLRRLTPYRDAALAAIASRSSTRCVIAEEPEAGRWGLHAFEDPRLDAARARPVWSACRDPFVLRCTAERARHGPDAFDIRAHAKIAVTVVSAMQQCVLLSDGIRAIRLDVSGACLGSGPALLHYQLSGVGSLARPLLTLRRFAALQEKGRFSAALHARDGRARRLVRVLRAFDALAAGATQRDIAGLILGAEEAQGRRWRSEAPSIRLQAQRLAAAARRMGAGGFWMLLA